MTSYGTLETNDGKLELLGNESFPYLMLHTDDEVDAVCGFLCIEGELVHICTQKREQLDALLNSKFTSEDFSDIRPVMIGLIN